MRDRWCKYIGFVNRLLVNTARDMSQGNILGAYIAAFLQPTLSALMVEFFNIWPRGIVIIDINTGHIVMANPFFQKKLGYSSSELKARPFIDFVHPEDYNHTILASQKALIEGNVVNNFVNRYVCKDGSSLYLRWNSVIIGRHYICEVELHDSYPC